MHRYVILISFPRNFNRETAAKPPLGKDQVTCSRNYHNHAAPVVGMVAAKIKYPVKQEAKQNFFRPASEVVNDVLLNELTDAPRPCLPPR